MGHKCWYCDENETDNAVCCSCIELFNNSSSSEGVERYYCFGCGTLIIGNFNFANRREDGDTLCRNCYNQSVQGCEQILYTHRGRKEGENELQTTLD